MKFSKIALAVSTALIIVGCANSNTPNTPQDNYYAAEDGIIYDGMQSQKEIYIWPNKRAPGDTSTVEEKITQRAKSGELSDRIYTGTQEPKLALYFPEKSNGTALILLPGGAYVRTVIDKEGEVLAPIFTKMGYTVAILNYRLPLDNHVEGPDAPIADTQRAIRVVKSLASEYNFEHVGIMGFSAGGHLASNVESKFNEQTYQPIDKLDELSARPDFAALIYPVATTDDAITHMQSKESLLGKDTSEELANKYSGDKIVKDDTPPTFIVHAIDDPDVKVDNSLRMLDALRQKGIEVEAHFFEKGGHGFGVRAVKDKPAIIWPTLFDNWQQDLVK